MTLACPAPGCLLPRFLVLSLTVQPLLQECLAHTHRWWAGSDPLTSGSLQASPFWTPRVYLSTVSGTYNGAGEDSGLGTVLRQSWVPPGMFHRWSWGPPPFRTIVAECLAHSCCRDGKLRPRQVHKGSG